MVVGKPSFYYQSHHHSFKSEMENPWQGLGEREKGLEGILGERQEKKSRRMAPKRGLVWNSGTQLVHR